jgi:hypothetical protein
MDFYRPLVVTNPLVLKIELFKKNINLWKFQLDIQPTSKKFFHVEE